jgi:hypothetical protein
MPSSNAAHLQEIEASVRLVRRRLSNAKMPIDELFKLMGEDDRKVLASLPRPRQPAEPTVPDDTPSAQQGS